MRALGAETLRSLAPLLVVVGPTASGKTQLGIRLACELGGELVSADSVQVYRYFDLGSAKPTPGEQRLAPHHLIDVAEPHEEVEASRFIALADAAIAEIRRRGRTPIICGGTFLWVRALLFGLADAPAGNAEIREKHRLFAEREGRAALHAELARVDAKTAQRLHENDLLRVSRALEVFELCGKKLSDLHGEHGFRTPRYAARLLGLGWQRSAHDQRVEVRARAMLDAGLVEEVESLTMRGFADARAMNAVGYRQVKDALTRGQASDSEALAVEIARATRVFARRQRTWLREEDIDWLPFEQRDDPEVFVRLLERCRAHLER